MRPQGTLVEGPRGGECTNRAELSDATGYPVGAGPGGPKGRSPPLLGS
jgi:hypothetical protein